MKGASLSIPSESDTRQAARPAPVATEVEVPGPRAIRFGFTPTRRMP
jgi:hypothetical protein